LPFDDSRFAAAPDPTYDLIRRMLSHDLDLLDDLAAGWITLAAAIQMLCATGVPAEQKPVIVPVLQVLLRPEDETSSVLAKAVAAVRAAPDRGDEVAAALTTLYDFDGHTGEFLTDR
jgi:hypothetical protein